VYSQRPAVLQSLQVVSLVLSRLDWHGNAKLTGLPGNQLDMQSVMTDECRSTACLLCMKV